MNNIVCIVARTQDELKGAFELRKKVFVEEQGVPVEEEMGKHDKSAVHVVAMREDKTVGTGRMVTEENKGRIGRMAVDATMRGQGIGRVIMMKLEEEANNKGLNEVYLHAQVHAQDFYTKLGYIPRGDVFDECGIPHQEMFKKL